MIPLYIYGFGGLARETRMWVSRAGLFEGGDFGWGGHVVSSSSFGHVDGRSVVGDEDWLLSRRHPIAVVLGFGDPVRRAEVGGRLEAQGVSLPSVIDPSVVYDKDSCKIEVGVVVTAGCILTVNVQLQRFSYVNMGCTVGHDATIGEGSLLNPGCAVSGNVSVGRGVLLGAGSTILEKTTIGDGSVVGAGALVNRDVAPRATVVGVPARPIGQTTSR